MNKTETWCSGGFLARVCALSYELSYVLNPNSAKKKKKKIQEEGERKDVAVFLTSLDFFCDSYHCVIYPLIA